MTINNKIVEKIPVGWAYHKIILDGENPVDYEFIDVNNEFERLTGLLKKNIIGKKVSEIIPDIKKSDFDWIGEYGKVALNSGEIEFENFSEPLNRWYRVKAVSDEKLFFTTFFIDITIEKEVLELSKELLKLSLDNINYQKISDNMMKISGASYVVFNMYDNERKEATTVGMSGFSEHINTVTKLFGFEIIGSKWSFIPHIDEKFRTESVIYFKKLTDLTQHLRPKAPFFILEKMFPLGEVILLRINNGFVPFGDMTLIYSNKKEKININPVLLYAQHLSLLLERLLAEEKEKKSNERFNLAVEGINDGIWDWDIPNDELYLSPKWKELLGYKDNELDNNFDTFIKLLHPDDVLSVLNYKDEFFKSGSDIYEKEFRMRQKNGTYCWVLARARALKDSNGKVIRMAGSHTDITERKVNEAITKYRENRFRDIVDAVGEIIFELDSNGLFTYVSEKAYITFGRHLNDIIGRNPLEFSFEDDKTLIIEKMIEASKFKKTIKDMEHRIITADGKVKWVSTSGIAMYDSNDYLIGYRGASKDIDEKKKSEEKLKFTMEKLEKAIEVASKLAAKAEAANLAKTHFLSNISHEIKTPMNGIIGFAEMLQDTELNEEQTEFNNLILKCSYYLLDLVNDLIDYSNLESEELKLNNETFSLKELLQGIASFYKTQIEEKPIELSLTFGENVPNKINFDKYRLNLLLNKLMSNAVKFTEKGEVELKVEIIKHPTEVVRDRLEFSVRDTGIGILPENQKKILDVFTQGDSTPNKKYGGSGLGLAICNKMLIKMQSQLEIESKPEEGSTFKFQIEI